MTERENATINFVIEAQKAGPIPKRFNAWRKAGIDIKDHEVALWYDSEQELIDDASDKGFNGEESIIVGDDMYFTAKVIVFNGEIIKYGIYDGNVRVGDCRDYHSMMMYLRGRDINEIEE